MLAALLLLGADAAPAAGTVVAEPLAPVAAGLAQCADPDPATKTCHALTVYTPDPAGGWSASGETLLRPDKPATLTVISHVRMNGTAYCGTLHRADLLAGTLKLGGQPLSPDVAAPLLAKLADAPVARALVDAELCESMWQTPAGLVMRATLAGKAVPIPDRAVRWVQVGDGWSAAPAGGPEAMPTAPGG